MLYCLYIYIIQMATLAAHKWHPLSIPDTTNKFSELFEASAKNAMSSIAETVQVNVWQVLNWIHDTFHIEHSFDDSRSSEELESLLKDQHGTFWVFQKAYELACDNIRIRQNQFSVPLYVQDIRNTDFLTLVASHKDSGIKPDSVILEIKPDDYGIFDTVALDHLIQAKKAGFWVSLYDGLVEKNGTIEATETLTKLSENKILPTIIYVGNRIFHALQNKDMKLWSNIKTLFKNTRIANAGEIKTQIHKNIINDKISELVLPLFQESRVEKEGIFELDGTLHANEWLIRFTKEISIIDGLDILKNIGATRHLLRFVAEDAATAIKEWSRNSINIFMKDLDNPYFKEFIYNLLTKKGLTSWERANLIFEIVEEPYGVLTKQVMENISFIQKELWCKIAIDDLYFDNADKNMSVDILQTLQDHKITPNYIKIDGKFVVSILDNTINPQHLRHIKELIAQLSIEENAPQFIFEWIQSTEDAIKICSLLQSYKKENGSYVETGKFLFQWRNLKAWSFWTRNTVKEAA